MGPEKPTGAHQLHLKQYGFPIRLMPLCDYPVYAGAVVRAPDGRILCQLRDEKPDIVCPGMWSCCPGGHVEDGESPRDAILRELREEFEIEVNGLTLLLTHVEHTGEFQGIYYAFHANLSTPIEDVKCKEGIRAEFFMTERAVELPQHPVSLIFLRNYMESETRDDTNHRGSHSQS